MARLHLAAFVAAVAWTLPTHLGAQEYSSERIEALDIEVKVHKKLKPVPVELGQERNVIDLHHQARFEPKSRQQFIVHRSQPFRWSMDVYLFEKRPDYKDKPTDQKEIRRRAVEKRRFDNMARNFRLLATTKDPRSSGRVFHGKGAKDGKKKKASGKTPAYTYYEYSNQDTIEDSGIEFRWYYVAAAYQLDDGREIALEFQWPVFKAKPDSKHLKIAKKMVTSLRLDPRADSDSAAGSARGDAEKDRYATTPERKKIVADAAAGIRGLDSWDYFTAEGCCVLYSWKPGSDKQRKARKSADTIVAHLDAVQELYQRQFQPHDKMAEHYPVLRICFDNHTFRLYGSPPLGTEGMFNAETGELVIIEGGKQDVEQLVTRYGWMQFAHAYFRGARLDPWFTEGFGDYFSAWQRSGRKWKYAPLKIRLGGPNGVRTVFKRGDNAGLKQILAWPQSRFESTDDDRDSSARALAQSYAVADMLMRGQDKLGSKWDDSWSKVLSTYSETLKKTRNGARARTAAFGGLDYKAFDAALSIWVKSHIQKK